METGLLQVASSFTCTPLEPSLRRAVAKAGIAGGLGFTQYAEISNYMLASDSAQIVGTLVLVRVEDWLRDVLKSSPVSVLDSSHRQVRENLRMRTDEFISQITVLSQRGKPVWFLACPSTGWISERHKLETVCRSYTNLLFARIQNLPQVTALRWPALLFEGEFEDRGADRLGQIPFTQDAFDKLGEFLGDQLARTWTRTPPSTSPAATGGSPELAAYLAGLRVKVQLTPATFGDRAQLDYTLRTAATFSLTGEKRDLSDADIDTLLDSGSCLLVSVSDRLSDYGPTGLVALRSNEDALVITSMALSCAVLGKQVEYAIISALAQMAAERHIGKLIFEYRPSERNQPMLSFLQSLADRESETRYVLPIAAAKARLRAAAVNPGAFTVKFAGNLTHSTFQ